MPARSGPTGLVLLVVSLGSVPALLGACSSSERRDSPNETTAPASCQVSNTCEGGSGSPLPAITDPKIVAGPCSTGKCIGSDGGTYEGSVTPEEDAAPEASVRPDAGGGNDASRPSDGGPG
jgi:hypothetical protein